MKSEVQWVTEYLPKVGETVLICREKEAGKPIVEQATLVHGGWWKIYGANCKRITAWAPMPEPPVLE